MAGKDTRRKRRIIAVLLSTLVVSLALLLWLLAKRDAQLTASPAQQAFQRASGSQARHGADQQPSGAHSGSLAQGDPTLAGGVVLSGTVFDADGGPIPEATLAAEWKRFELGTDANRRVFPFKADTGGKFVAHLQAGHYRVLVAADGYASTEAWLDLAASLQRDFRLERAGSIAGRVATRAGEPVANALVELMVTGAYRIRPGGGDPRAPAKVGDAQADPEGRFRFPGVPSGNYLLVARKGKLVGQRTQVVTVERGSAVENADVTVDEGPVVQGRVTSAAHVPIARARVSLTAGGFNPHLVHAVETGADGTFTIEGLLPGVYRLDAGAPGFGSFIKEIAVQGPSVGHEIVLPAATSVQGRVLSADNRAVPNASITLWNAPDTGSKDKGTRTISSDNNGAFVFDGLIPGYFWLEAADCSGVAALGPEAIVAGERRRVELRFGAGGSISGQVKWKDGPPARDVLVRCKGALLDRSARTDAAGAYRCSSLTEDLYTVAALKNLADEPWYLSSPYSADAYGGTRVELSAGQHILGVQLELNRGHSSVSGIVVEADGSPAANVAVDASREFVHGVTAHAKNPRAIDGQTVTLDDGTFQIDNLPEGPYQLRAQSIDGEGRQDHVPAGGRARIQLQRTGTLRGAVVERDGRPVTSFTLAVYMNGNGVGASYEDVVALAEGPAVAVQTVFDGAGRFEVAGLRAAAYEVVASTADQRIGRVAALLTPTERQPDLKITLEKPASVVGHVLDYDTGAPIESCRVHAVFNEREVEAFTGADGSFKLEGPAAGEAVRLHFIAADHIQDGHTARLKRSGEGIDIGTIKLIRGSWVGKKPRFLEWMLEGRVESSAVVGVRPGSQPERAGVVSGAVLLKVGGKDARHLGPISIHYLTCGDTPLPMVLQLPNGSVRTFEL